MFVLITCVKLSGADQPSVNREQTKMAENTTLNEFKSIQADKESFELAALKSSLHLHDELREKLKYLTMQFAVESVEYAIKGTICTAQTCHKRKGTSM